MYALEYFHMLYQVFAYDLRYASISASSSLA